MYRTLGLLFALVLWTSTALAQGMRMALPDHWITADSLAKAIGGDASVATKAAPHLTEVDRIMKQAAEERSKMFSGGRPDQATMQGFRTKAEGWQKSVDEHLKMIRDGLDEKQQATFDALQKPQMMMRGGRGMGGAEASKLKGLGKREEDRPYSDVPASPDSVGARPVLFPLPDVVVKLFGPEERYLPQSEHARYSSSDS